jgi:hypothetical protein
LDLYSLSRLCLAVRPCHRSRWSLPYAKIPCATLPCETALMTSRLCSRLVGGSFVLPATASLFLKGHLRLVVQAGRAQEWSVSLLAIPLPQWRPYSNLHTGQDLMAAVTVRFVSGVRPSRFCGEPSRGYSVWCHVRRLRHQSAG